MSARDDDRADRVSLPFRCKHCGANAWHVFEGDKTTDAEPHVWVRLRCANPRCPVRHKRIGSCVARRWKADPIGVAGAT